MANDLSLPAPYAVLLDRAVAVLGGDDRVVAVWLSGSFARGAGDAASDLDLLVTTTDQDYQSFLDDARRWWARITPTVFLASHPAGPNIWYSVTPDGCRLDIVVEKESTLPSTRVRQRVPLVDPGGLIERMPAPEAPPGPDVPAVSRFLAEIFRVLCLLKVIVIREDWLLGVQGCALLQHLLADLYAAADGTAGGTGAKRYSSRLTPDQQATLRALPPIQATREAVVAGHRAVLEVVTATVPSLAAGLSIEWPAALEHTAREQVAQATSSSLSSLGD